MASIRAFFFENLTRAELNKYLWTRQVQSLMKIGFVNK